MARSKFYKFKEIQRIKEVAEILGVTFEEAKELCEMMAVTVPEIEKLKLQIREEGQHAKAQVGN